jgi:hypothetical protein
MAEKSQPDFQRGSRVLFSTFKSVERFLRSDQCWHHLPFFPACLFSRRASSLLRVFPAEIVTEYYQRVFREM